MQPEFLAALAASPAIVLAAAGVVPSGLADRHPRLIRSCVVWLCGIAFAAAATVAVFVARGAPVDYVAWEVPGIELLNVGVFADALTGVMLSLVCFIGLVIARFAARALEGEAHQGRFFRWLSLTLSGVCVFIASRNLLMLTAAWMLTSYGLHHLLQHYPDRPWAIWAARKKFLISRLGDAFLLTAVGLTIWRFGTGDYTLLFGEADAITRSGLPVDASLNAIGILLVLGAMTKSAQVPFHSWLPDTMEAPTPVSALMHAGIINAGGFMVIRLSPLISLSHVALDLLAVVGMVTALFGGVVMLTQTSIKRALAFSTIAQMGFMMLQCGLGAFAAALLHIVAHSIYKAHAFLACGSVLDAAARRRLDGGYPAEPLRTAGFLPLAMMFAAGAVAAGAAATGISPASKPGGLVLAAVMAIALTTLVWQSLRSGSWSVALGGCAAACGVSVGYAVAMLLVDRLLATSAVAHQAGPAGLLDMLIAGAVVLGFVAVFAVQAAASALAWVPTVRGLYVHASNGFYLDIPARRLTARCWGLKAPVP